MKELTTPLEAHDFQTQVTKLATFTPSEVANFFTLHGDQNGHSLEHCNDCLKRLEIHVHVHVEDLMYICF